MVDWGTKLNNLNRRIEDYQKRLANAQKIAKYQKFEWLLEHVNVQTYHFILSQIRNQTQVPKARRFTLEDKILALSLLKSSGRGYRLLSKVFVLPSRRTLTNLVNKIPFRPGVQKRTFETLRSSVEEMKSFEKYCVVIFDEVSISCNLNYNIKEDCIDGIEDFGTTRNRGIADHANVFFIKGIFKSWKQPVCFTFSNGPTKSHQLKSLIKDVVIQCQEIGLKVVATVCDQGGPNRAAIHLLQKETNEFCIKKNIDNRYYGYLINNHEIVQIYDIPHLFKGIRNNLITKNLHFKQEDIQKIAKWEHIYKLYMLDIEEPHRICKQLSDKHILPEKMNKMKVSACTQVFSNTVGTLMERIAKWGKHISIENCLKKITC